MCMPFDFIDGLKDEKWTHIDQKWLAKLMRHLKKAQSSIKQIKFIRHIGRLDIHDNSREYEIEDDCYTVGYHTRKITLPVIPLTVPVTLPIPVMSDARTGIVCPFILRPF